MFDESELQRCGPFRFSGKSFGLPYRIIAHEQAPWQNPIPLCSLQKGLWKTKNPGIKFIELLDDTNSEKAAAFILTSRPQSSINHFLWPRPEGSKVRKAGLGFMRRGDEIMTLLVPLALIIVLAVYIITLYNGLVRTRNAVKNAWSQIDVQLK